MPTLHPARGEIEADIRRDLAPFIDQCADRNGLENYEATVAVELTGAEVVDVAVGARNLQFGDCVEEAVWNLALPVSGSKGRGKRQWTFSR